ncbi:hypothetical protein CRYUN_Cryun12cG0005800 [Craigia yunnanensis]
MSNTGSSTPEISEEHDKVNTPEISEEHDEGNTQEISEEHDKANAPEISEEHDEGNTQEISEEQNEGNTQEISQKDSGVRKLTATEVHAKKIFDLLVRDYVSKIILTGEAGTGKTWMARKISESVMKEKHDEPIWISLDKMHDEESLYDTIARQFSPPTITDVWVEDSKNEKKKNVKG